MARTLRQIADEWNRLSEGEKRASQMRDHDVEMYYRRSEFRDRYASAFAHPLTSNGILGQFVSNSAVTGSYAEAWVRQLIQRMLPHMRISTGAVVRDDDAPEALRDIPQADIIIWDPTLVPAAFESGDFAVVYSIGVAGIIEVKRSGTPKVEQLRRLRGRLEPARRNYLLTLILQHNVDPWPHDQERDWLADLGSDEYPILRLLAGDGKPHADSIWELVYFLSSMRIQYR